MLGLAAVRVGRAHVPLGAQRRLGQVETGLGQRMLLRGHYADPERPIRLELEFERLSVGLLEISSVLEQILVLPVSADVFCEMTVEFFVFVVFDVFHL